MINYYIVTFDRNPNLGYRAFHDAFVAHPQIKLWWHYIKSSYIIGTELEVGAISEHFTETAKRFGFPTTHLVLKVDLSKRQGMLVKDAWEWIRKNSQN